MKEAEIFYKARNKIEIRLLINSIILQAKSFRTPTIRSITPLSGTPGLLYNNQNIFFGL